MTEYTIKEEPPKKGSALRAITVLLAVLLFLGAVFAGLVPAFTGSLDAAAQQRIISDARAYGEYASSPVMGATASLLEYSAGGGLVKVMLAALLALVFLLIVLNARRLRWLVPVGLPLLLSGGALIAVAALLPALLRALSSNTAVDWAFYAPYLDGFGRLLFLGGGVLALLGAAALVCKIIYSANKKKVGNRK